MPQTASKNSELVLGVDGGGTKTIAGLAAKDDADELLGRGTAGPSNPRAVGFEKAQANIDAAIDAAFAAAQLPRTAVAAACLALAGAGRPAEQEKMVSWASNRRIAEKVRVTTDAEPILAAASAENSGVALICGTGSLAWGRNKAGAVARAGGWGYLLGDEGGAYWLSLSGLRAALRAHDGRDRTTALLPGFLERLHLAEPRDLVDWVHDAATTPSQIASLAPTVFDLAATDEVAANIIDTGAMSLADIIAAVAQRLGFSPVSYPLALAGSVLLNQPTYRDQALAYLADRNLHPATVTIIEEPVRGAVAIARKMCLN
ncbi:MAG: BadF/BadG/BcrA/BcrD ATPase family protein [Pirellulales bacterium]